MLLSRTIAAAGIISVCLGPAWAENAVALKPTVTPLLQTSQTAIGQPIAYPAGTAEVTAMIITIPPGGETSWHVHAVPLFGNMLQGALTVAYGARDTRK